MANYSKKFIEKLQGDLLDFLKRNGPSTKLQISGELKWYRTRVSYVLGSRPDWLVAVGLTNAGSKFGRLVQYHCEGEHVLGVCQTCGRRNFHPSYKNKGICHSCLAKKPKPKQKLRLIPDVDVSLPTSVYPNTEEKLRVLEARFDLNLPLHLEGDARYERGSLHYECFQIGDEWDED